MVTVVAAAAGQQEEVVVVLLVGRVEKGVQRARGFSLTLRPSSCRWVGVECVCVVGVVLVGVGASSVFGVWHVRHTHVWHTPVSSLPSHMLFVLVTCASILAFGGVSDECARHMCQKAAGCTPCTAEVAACGGLSVLVSIVFCWLGCNWDWLCR